MHDEQLHPGSGAGKGGDISPHSCATFAQVLQDDVPNCMEGTERSGKAHHRGWVL